MNVAPLLIVALLAPGRAPSPQEGSLEELLHRARAERAAAQARLRAPVEELVGRLEGHGGNRPKRELDTIRADIDRLGPEAALVLLPYLDPGTEAGDEQEFRAREVTAALVRMRAPGIVEALVARTQSGPLDARLHAVRVLGTSPESERASVVLRAMLPTAGGALRLEVVRALAGQGGQQNTALLRTALTDDDPAVVGAVLEALAVAKSTEAFPIVLNLTRVPKAAERVVPEILAYYESLPDLVDEEVVGALLRLALRDELFVQSRVLLLKAIPTFEAAKGPKLRRQLAPLFDESNTLLREAALVCATLLGDRAARRDLLREHDQVVDDNERWPDAYQRRGDVHLLIHEYSDAARDYRQTLELLGPRARQRAYHEIWIALARAYVLSGKLRQAYDALRNPGLDPVLREQITNDPDFAPLREIARYRDVFG